MTGEQLDISSESAAHRRQNPDGTSPAPRRFLGIHFACCGVYARVYVNQTGTAYIGHCPRCGKRVELQIGPGGTDGRFFTAY